MSRYTCKRRRPARMLHLSASLIHEIDEQTGQRRVFVSKGKTYRKPAELKGETPGDNPDAEFLGELLRRAQ